MPMQLTEFDHQPGEHCGSTSLRNLSAFYGWGYDEPMCFGLASGLGFTFFKLPESPKRMFVGRPLWLERAFFENLDVPHTDTEGGDWDDSWSAVKGRLDNGDPVMVFVDLYYLDYYDTDTHFAPHSLLVVGYDETCDTSAGSGDVVYLSDSEFGEIQELPLASLRDAWAAKDVLPLENRYLVVEGDPQTSTEAAAREAVRETATYMLTPDDTERGGPPFGAEGVPGIRTFAADLPSWHELDDPRWTVRFAYQNVERRGTGGGAFRGLYAPFLDRLDAAAGLDSSFADRMHEIADAWTVVGETFYEASEADDARFRTLLEDASDYVHALADREERFYEDVLDTL